MIAGFDAAAATAAYLATLPPAAHAKAVAYTHGSNWLLLWSAVATIIAAWIILKSGLLRRVQRRVDAHRPRPNLAAFACALAFLIVDFVIELPWATYASWWRERSYGLTSQSWSGWLGEQALSGLISAVVMSLLALFLYLLIRKAPRSWWLWTGGIAALFLAFAIILSPIFIEPLFNRYTPAPPGPLRDQIVALAKASGVPSDKIYVYNGSKQSNRYTANVSGLFGSARVAMSDTMFKQGADLSEVRAVVGHEMGHYARKDVLWQVLGLSIIAIILLFLVDRLFPRVRRWAGANDVQGLADPAGLPVIIMMVAVLGLLATPFVNSISRIAEAGADSFSLQHAHEPDGMAKALVKTIEYRAASPSRLEEILFYDHPSVRSRVRKSMDWKAAHPQEVGRPPN